MIESNWVDWVRTCLCIEHRYIYKMMKYTQHISLECKLATMYDDIFTKYPYTHKICGMKKFHQEVLQMSLANAIIQNKMPLWTQSSNHNAYPKRQKHPSIDLFTFCIFAIGLKKKTLFVTYIFVIATNRKRNCTWHQDMIINYYYITLLFRAVSDGCGIWMFERVAIAVFLMNCNAKLK